MSEITAGLIYSEASWECELVPNECPMKLEIIIIGKRKEEVLTKMDIIEEREDEMIAYMERKHYGEY